MINFDQILRRVEGSDEFKNFKKENDDAYLCSAFFVIDFESQAETKQLDYYVPSKDKIGNFIVDSEIKFMLDNIFEEKKKAIQQISSNVKIGFQKAIEIANKVVEKENQEEEKHGKITKIIGILQKLDKEQIWNFTCMLGTMNMLLLHINSETGEILKNQKSSLMNFIRRV